MLIDKITEEDLEFIETLYHPRACAECLFSNIDNLAEFDEDKFIDIWLAQIPMLSFEFMVDEDPNLSEKENFDRRKNSADKYVFGARNFGKTKTVEELDFNIYTFHAYNEPAGFSSFNHKHLQYILDRMVNVWEHHPIVSMFNKRVLRNPYTFESKNGVNIIGINQNINKGSQAGDDFYQKHLKRHWMEEASKETDTVHKKRVHSRHILGCIERFAGMTDFISNSPAGEIFEDKDKRKFLINLPSFCNPYFSKKQNEDDLKEYGGEGSIGYRVYDLGEKVEEGLSVIDMERVSLLCYPKNKKGEVDETITIKRFEVDKKSFIFFKHLLIMNRPKNVDRIWICADIGALGGISEIIVVSELDGKCRWLYRITLRNLDDKQQYSIIKHIYTIFNANYIALDCTGGTGQAIYKSCELDPEIGKKKIVWVAFNENITTDYEKDDKGNPKKEKGKIIYKYNRTDDWSILYLINNILYEAKIYLPYDYDLDRQLNSVMAIITDAGIHYKCMNPNDHLFQAFQVFSIAYFKREFEGFSKEESTFKEKCKKACAGA